MQNFQTPLLSHGLHLYSGAYQPSSMTERTKSDNLISATELESLVRYLRDQPGRFFIFPDFTFLYGVTGKLSPISLLWFHKGLTYPADYSKELDQQLVTELSSAQVQVIVVERESFLGTKRRLDRLPLLSAWLADGSYCPHHGFFELRIRPSATCPSIGLPALPGFTTRVWSHYCVVQEAWFIASSKVPSIWVKRR